MEGCYSFFPYFSYDRFLKRSIVLGREIHRNSSRAMVSAWRYFRHDIANEQLPRREPSGVVPSRGYTNHA